MTLDTNPMPKCHGPAGIALRVHDGHCDCYFELGRPGIWLRMDLEKPPSTQMSCPVT